MTGERSNERNDQHIPENLTDPGPVQGVSERDAQAARKALRDSTPGKIR